MTNEKNPDQLVAASMSRLFGGLGPATANPMGVAASAKLITGKFRIEGKVTWADDNTPVVGVSLGFGSGIECVTDAEGRFNLLVEKK